MGKQVSKEEAIKRIEEIKEPYKLEILEDISSRHPDAPITIYHIGEPGSKEHWWDLCAGPHVETTGHINPAAVDLENVAGPHFYPMPHPLPLRVPMFGQAGESVGHCMQARTGGAMRPRPSCSASTALRGSPRSSCRRTRSSRRRQPGGAATC